MSIKVFVSSTYVDLKDHRQRVIAQLRKAGYHVDPMEDWTSDADEPKQFSLDRLDGCQACVLLVGFRRGFIPAGQERSITQIEYEHALARQIDVLPFLLDDGVTGWPDQYDDRRSDPPLQAWRVVYSKRAVNTWGLVQAGLRANRVTTLFTSVRNEADRVGPT